MPCTFGVPFSPGRVPRDRGFAVLAGARALPTQTRVLTSWPDGSVSWLRVDVLLPASLSGSLSGSLVLRESAGTASASGEAQGSPSRWLDPEAPWRGRGPGLPEEACSWCLALVDAGGKAVAASRGEAAVVTDGPVLRSEQARWQYPGLDGLVCELELDEYHATGGLRWEVARQNPRRARHAGGIWDLGDPGSTLFGGFRLDFPALPAGRASISIDGGGSFEPLEGGSVELYQASSGGENWQSAAHVDSTGATTLPFRGYRLRGDLAAKGARARPVGSVENERARLSVAVPEFWQNFPKILALEPGRLTVGLFPEAAAPFELQGGERKTHVVWAALGAAPESLRGVFSPPVVHARYEHYRESGAVPAAGPDTAALDSLLAQALDGPGSLYANREKVDEYGWRHWGEIHAQHEEQHYEGALPLISHYNNQFDLVQGFLINFLRTGDERLFRLGDALARHVSDIDIYWTDEDRPEYNGGLFWFTDHYLHARTSTHRAYSRLNQPPGQDYGGGPGAEHNFTTGLLLHHGMTGNPASGRALRSLADWVIDMDCSGLLGPRGTATMTADPEYHGPGRGAGNSLNAVLDGWLLTGEPRYLAFGEKIIRRVVHPADDIDAWNLLGAEKRWSYTVFLSALAKYLRIKAATGQIDERYAYARASLLHYARWMTVNERPYFDHVEELEFPTEAWPAQELRKANVLLLAAEHVRGDEADRFLEKGSALRSRAWTDLMKFETRVHARALAIAMIEGVVGSAFPDPPPSTSTEPPATDFGSPSRFRPWPVILKRIVRRVVAPRG